MERQVDVFWIARYDYEPDWRVLPHSHDFFQLFYVLDGEGTALVRNKSVDVSEGRILLVQPHVEHSISASKGVALKTLDTKFKVNCSEFRQELSRIIEPLDDRRGQIRQLLERIRSEGMQRRGWYRPLCNALLVQVFILLLRLRSGDDNAQCVVSEKDLQSTAGGKIRNFIHENFNRDLSLKEIADYIGYSPEYLSKLFSSMMGVSVHHYLMHVRMEHAKELLKYSQLPIKEVSSECGFKSIHHFSRAFKDYQGAPPAAWRDQEQEGIWKNVVISPGFINKDLTITEDEKRRIEKERG